MPLIVSLMKAMDILLPNVDDNYNYVSKLNKKIIDKLKEYSLVHINSTDILFHIL